MIFENRQEAGKQLALQLIHFRNEHPIVLGIPRGGVVLAFEVAEILLAPLDVIVARKIGAPRNQELGIGAIAEGDVQVLDIHTIETLDITKEELEKVIKKEKEELKRRVSLYRRNNPPLQLQNQTVILVDDGLATGVTAKAAIVAITKQKPKSVIFAAPVCAKDAAEELGAIANEVLCLTAPSGLSSIGQWYKDFVQVTDQEVIELLELNRRLARQDNNNA